MRERDGRTEMAQIEPSHWQEHEHDRHADHRPVDESDRWQVRKRFGSEAQERHSRGRSDDRPDATDAGRVSDAQEQHAAKNFARHLRLVSSRRSATDFGRCRQTD